MKYIYKILRISAWILMFVTFFVLISAFTPAKNYLFPKFLNFDYQRHAQFAIFGFLPFFLIHSTSGLIVLISRHPKINKRNLKIITAIAWILLNSYFIYAYFSKGPVSPPGQNNTVNGRLLPSNITQPYTLNANTIALHNKLSDCWMIIEGSVYNLSSYASHPGRDAAIAKYCGKDGSIGFATKDRNKPHSSFASNLLADFYIGKLGQIIDPSNLPSSPIQNNATTPSSAGGEIEDD